jgi:hypothetical protein
MFPQKYRNLTIFPQKYRNLTIFPQKCLNFGQDPKKSNIIEKTPNKKGAPKLRDEFLFPRPGPISPHLKTSNTLNAPKLISLFWFMQKTRHKRSLCVMKISVYFAKLDSGDSAIF